MAADPSEIRQRIAEQIGLAEPENRAPRRVFFRGRYLEFPPGTTDEQIEQALRAPASEFISVSEARGVPAPWLADLVERLQDVPLADFVAGGLLEALRKRALGMQVSPAEAGAAALDVFPGFAGVTRGLEFFTRIRPLGDRRLYRGVVDPAERERAVREGVVEGYGSAELGTPGTSTSVDPLVSMRPAFSGIPYGAEAELALGLVRNEITPYDIPVFRISPARAGFPILVADVDPVSYLARRPIPSAGPGVAALSKPNLLFKEAEVFFRRDIPDFVQPVLRATPLEKDELVKLLRDRGAIKSRIREAKELFFSPGFPEVARYKVYEPSSKIAAGMQLLKEAAARSERYRGLRVEVLEASADLIRSLGVYEAPKRLLSIPLGEGLTFGGLVSSAERLVDSSTRVRDLWNVMGAADNPMQAVELVASAYNKDPNDVIDTLIRPALKEAYKAYDEFARTLRKVDLGVAVRQDTGEDIREAYDAFVRTKVRGLRQRRGKARADRGAR